MLTATEGSIKLLSESDGEIIAEGLALAKLALERLYKSKDQLHSEEILDDLTKVAEIADRLKSTGNLGEKTEIFFSEYQTLSKHLKTKYSDFLSNILIKKIEAGEKYVEGIEKLLIAQRYMLQAFDDKDLETQASKLYTGMVKLSEVLEQYIPYFPRHLIEIIKNVALGILADPALQPDQLGISQTVVNYLIALKNTARDVLWQLDNYRKKKHTVGELLDWLETAPGWAGDDFKECLEYVNEVRK